MEYVNPLTRNKRLLITIPEMVKMYEEGGCLLGVGLAAGVSEGTARNVLVANGVKLRRAGRRADPFKYSTTRPVKPEQVTS